MCLKYEQGATAPRQPAVAERCEAEPHTVLQPRMKRQYLAAQLVLTVPTVLMGTGVGGAANCRRP